MTQRTPRRPSDQTSAPTAATLEPWLVAGSVALLASLALADRLVAWMIGEFPASAALWQLRFEYLRPIGVFYDIALINLGQVSPLWFGAVVLAVALTIGGAAVSGVRLARALSSHLLLGAVLVLTVYSVDPGEGIYAEVGNPSSGYVLIGILLAIPAALICARVHAEYIGWNPASSRIARRLNGVARRALSYLGDAAGELLDQAIPSVNKVQAVAIRARRRNSSAR